MFSAWLRKGSPAIANGSDELDTALTAANSRLARARYDFAEKGTQEAANAYMLAPEEADRLGRLHLRARFEHQAQEAGLYVDPSVFEVDVDVDPVAEEVARLQDERAIYDAVIAALRDPHGILDTLLQSED